MKKIVLIVWCACVIALATCYAVKPDKTKQVENSLQYKVRIKGEKEPLMSLADRMKFYKTPAVSIAVIDKGKIAWAKGYGTISLEPNAPAVTTETLFQAGSISKPVTAIGALLLVQQGRLSLDEDVNKYLKSWKVPENEYTKTEKVTLRRLLSHTAGTSVHGFPGYKIGEYIPTTVEILEGEKPQVNTDPVRVIKIPGTECLYSGGGTVIVQLLIEDITGEPFDSWMKKNILIPFNMISSTFDQPFSQEDSKRAAHGYQFDGKKVPGCWHIYPEQSAAGLWTTPTDLARFALTLSDVLKGEKQGQLSQEMVREALKLQHHNPDSDGQGPGLGFFINNPDKKSMIFMHGGVDEGFQANLVMYPKLKKGWIIMVDSNNGAGLIKELEQSIAQVYDIPGREPLTVDTFPFAATEAQKYVGSYIYKDSITTITLRKNSLFVSSTGSQSFREKQLYYAGNDTFFAKEFSEVLFQFVRSGDQLDCIVLLSRGSDTPMKEDGIVIEFKRVQEKYSKRCL